MANFPRHERIKKDNSKRQVSNRCDQCDGGDGKSVFPYYGLQPHMHLRQIGKTYATGEIPVNFKPDPESKLGGVYEYCINCGAGAEYCKSERGGEK